MAGVSREVEISGERISQNLRAVKLSYAAYSQEAWTDALPAAGRPRHEMALDRPGEDLEIRVRVDSVHEHVDATACPPNPVHRTGVECIVALDAHP